MNTLIDWLGKADDITISYNIDLSANRLLPENIEPISESKMFPDNNEQHIEYYRKVTEAVFERTISKADKIDYLMAVACGSIAGLIDIFYVGEFSLEKAHEWGSEKTDSFVVKTAKICGFKGEDLSDAIRYLEKKYPIAADKCTPIYGGGRQHHLRDFSHHFSLGGLLFSLFTQFSKKVIGTDTDGTFRVVSIEDDQLIGNDIPQKLLFGIVHWFFHMVSDMAGSSSSAGKGTGIPGPLVALIKEVSAIPCFRDKKVGEVEFHTWVSKLFNGALLAKRDDNGNLTKPLPFDLRTEIGVLHEVGEQFIPVLINECLVRGLYFIRRLFLSIKELEIESIKDFKKINIADILPYNSRAIRRMVTVSSGVFVAIDTSDTAVRAAIKNQGIQKDFIKDFVVRINIVGVGHFAVACVTDIRLLSEDIRKEKEYRDRIVKEYEKVISEFSCLQLDYKQRQVLCSIEQLIIKDDIKTTNDIEKREKKESWNTEWKEHLKREMQLTDGGLQEFFLTEQEIADYLDIKEKGPWKQLLALEAVLFKPYYPFAMDDKDKNYQNLKCNSKYLSNRFVTIQDSITSDIITAIKKTYKQAVMKVTGTTKKIAISAAGTTALVIVTGGIAYFFAPAIATSLVGGSASGLYGAALTSYSLATLGGGSIAAGGLGMAGGTAIITGGGALLGMLGGSGATAISAVNSLSNDSFVLSECCKLLTFSKAVLLTCYHDKFAIANIQATIDERISFLKKEVERFEIEKSEEEKKKRKTAKRSMRYLERCNSELLNLLHEL